MILPDVNVLVYAHREDARDHRAYRDWLESTANADAALGLTTDRDFARFPGLRWRHPLKS